MQIIKTIQGASLNGESWIKTLLRTNRNELLSVGERQILILIIKANMSREDSPERKGTTLNQRLSNVNLQNTKL